MSKKHPVIAVTGSSGAGTSTVKNSFEQIFCREKINVAVVEGDSFHRYDRAAMKKAVAKSVEKHGRPISHFGPEANEFKKLETLFKEYSKNGSGKTRLYLHNDEEGAPYKQKAGTFTPWSSIARGSDMLFYEGLHGGVKSSTADVAKYVDLLVGVVPAVNLEWIQKNLP
jgi:phosphoribulokinase